MCYAFCAKCYMLCVCLCVTHWHSQLYLNVMCCDVVHIKLIFITFIVTGPGTNFDLLVLFINQRSSRLRSCLLVQFDNGVVHFLEVLAPVCLLVQLDNCVVHSLCLIPGSVVYTVALLLSAGTCSMMSGTCFPLMLHPFCLSACWSSLTMVSFTS